MRPEWRIKRHVVSASIFALMVCAGILSIKANAAVTEDNFLVRSTGDLVDLCKATPADPYYTAAINFCHGFSVGVYRVLEEENPANPRHIFCVSDHAPRRADAIAAFVQWADAHPDQKNLGPADGITAYLQQQFPCARGH